MKFCAPDIFSGVSNRFPQFNDISGNLIRAVASLKKCTSRPIVPHVFRCVWTHESSTTEGTPCVSRADPSLRSSEGLPS